MMYSIGPAVNIFNEDRVSIAAPNLMNEIRDFLRNIMNDIFNKIETWNDQNITEALEELKNNRGLKEEVLERYRGVLNGLNKKSLTSLKGLPAQWNKMNSVKRWKLISEWPAEVPFFTEKVSLMGVESNQANHEEWQPNGIDTIGDEIGKLKNVTQLYLRDLPLVAISENIGQMEALKEFTLYDCGISEYKNDQYVCDLDLPKRLFSLKNLENIQVSFTRITTIPEEISQAKNLVSFIADHTSIDRVPEGMGHLPKLTKLDLSHNQYLSALPDTILDLPLQGLNIQGSNIPQDFIERLIQKNYQCKITSSTLENIDFNQIIDQVDFSAEVSIALNSRKLTSFPPKINEAQNLRHLNLSYNRLATLGDTITTFKHLESLNLEGNGYLTALPEALGKLDSLKELNIGSLSSLQAIPSSIGNLSNLEILKLGYNDKLESLPSTIGNLKKLEVLDLSSGSLEGLPAEIALLENLKALDLSGKLFNNTSEILQKLPVLQKLYISGNADNLAVSLGQFTSLKQLTISYIETNTLPDCFADLKQLQEFTILSTPIHSLPVSFRKLTNLTYLRIDNTQITEFPAVIESLVNLKRLALISNAKITSLPDFIGNLSQLEVLELNHSPKLSQIPETLSKLTKLKELSIVGSKKLSKNKKAFSQLQSMLPVDCVIRTSYA